MSHGCPLYFSLLQSLQRGENPSIFTFSQLSVMCAMAETPFATENQFCPEIWQKKRLFHFSFFQVNHQNHKFNLECLQHKSQIQSVQRILRLSYSENSKYNLLYLNVIFSFSILLFFCQMSNVTLLNEAPVIN